jgi:biotin carboxyl carrier protein
MVAEGDSAIAGTPIVTLEAVKMQHTVSAPLAGVVSALEVTAGQQIESNHVLAVID